MGWGVGTRASGKWLIRVWILKPHRWVGAPLSLNQLLYLVSWPSLAASHGFVISGIGFMGTVGSLSSVVFLSGDTSLYQTWSSQGLAMVSSPPPSPERLLSIRSITGLDPRIPNLSFLHARLNLLTRNAADCSPPHDRCLVHSTEAVWHQSEQPQSAILLKPKGFHLRSTKLALNADKGVTLLPRDRQVLQNEAKVLERALKRYVLWSKLKKVRVGDRAQQLKALATWVWRHWVWFLTSHLKVDGESWLILQSCSLVFIAQQWHAVCSPPSLSHVLPPPHNIFLKKLNISIFTYCLTKDSLKWNCAVSFY